MSKYDSFSKNNRRLAGYDYRWEGLYFITICTQGRQPFFGEVVNEEMVLSAEGRVVHTVWLELEQHWPRLFLGEFVVMPNHVHGIIGLEGMISDGSDLGNEVALTCDGATMKNEYMAALSPKAGSISRVIGFYKSVCTKMIRSLRAEPFGWQPRFHDRIIRNQRELLLIENYILSNPAKWQEDKFYQAQKM
ncbi:transposase [Rufibacter hautae]|uniref:Transposase n=1 Tax=Rufibacter hautae TaxID=2595005 RepID=A0A5B6TIW0_9BACT|nr:transposase [Rufibacter hautae]KAA3439420.1 transposase [Rufibacter hautae]